MKNKEREKRKKTKILKVSLYTLFWIFCWKGKYVTSIKEDINKEKKNQFKKMTTWYQQSQTIFYPTYLLLIATMDGSLLGSNHHRLGC